MPLPESRKTSPSKGFLSRLDPQQQENLYGYIFMIPWFIGFLTLTAFPIFASLYLSFTDYDLFTSPEWVGLQNYVEMFTRDSRYVQSLEVTFRYVLLSVPLKLIMALLVAAVLERGLRGLPLYRAIYYLPSLLGGSVAISILWLQVFGRNGLFNGFLALFGIEGMSWIGHPHYALNTLIVLAVWQFGAPMVIFLAGLKQIPRTLYEAAEIDGAGTFTKFTRITIPLITPLIFFNLILQVIGSFQAFTPAFIISDGTGGPVDSTLFYTLYLYQQGFSYFRMGYASSMAWVLLAIIGVFTAINFFASRYWVYYGDEDR